MDNTQPDHRLTNNDVQKTIIDLNIVAKEWGFDDDLAMIEEYFHDSLCPGVCKECGFSTEVEPDQERGWCDDCGKTSVVSIMVIADII
jgi:hypothetical protein